MTARFWCRAFSLLALLTIPVVYGVYHYLGTHDAWASKSGPIMTVFAILAAQRAQMMGEVLRSDGQFEPDEFISAQERYGRSAVLHMNVATWLAVLGAFIGVFAG
ncbi:hypothetical protein CS390_15330 [Pseudomonas sp. HLS-6]|nr:hypothetical protein CS390_15330 [Pseudomonas sp. HLS-6]